MCRTCRTRKTPMWRHGPDGPKTLCNACGVRWKLGKAPRTKQAPRKRRAETRPDAKDADVVAKKPRVEPELEEAETPPLVVDEVPESERARADHRPQQRTPRTPPRTTTKSASAEIKPKRAFVVVVAFAASATSRPSRRSRSTSTKYTTGGGKRRCGRNRRGRS